MGIGCLQQQAGCWAAHCAIATGGRDRHTPKEKVPISGIAWLGTSANPEDGPGHWAAVQTGVIEMRAAHSCDFNQCGDSDAAVLALLAHTAHNGVVKGGTGPHLWAEHCRIVLAFLHSVDEPRL